MMSGEVKYDTLPFIDVSGKDVFETGEEIEEPGINNAELKSDAVEHLSLDTKKSFDMFKNKFLDSSNADFSDRIQRSLKGGFQAKSVFEIIGEQVAKETPQQKYQRLQLELQELSDEMQHIESTKCGETRQLNPVELSQQVNQLQKQLHDLHLEKVLGPEVVGSNGIQPGTWTNEILNQLQSVKAHQIASKVDSQENFVYELCYKPEHTKFAQCSKILELEAKLKELEHYVGTVQHGLETVIDHSPETNNLMEIAVSIQAKLSLFDISHIDIIATRLQGLLHCINEISQKKETMDHVETQGKIHELHELITGWDSVGTVVPDLIEQLKSLHSLNEQAVTFSQSLQHLTSTQIEVVSKLRAQNDLLCKVEKSFADNINIIQSNCCALETRVNNLMSTISE